MSMMEKLGNALNAALREPPAAKAPTKGGRAADASANQFPTDDRPPAQLPHLGEVLPGVIEPAELRRIHELRDRATRLEAERVKWGASSFRRDLRAFREGTDQSGPVPDANDYATRKLAVLNQIMALREECETVLNPIVQRVIAALAADIERREVADRAACAKIRIAYEPSPVVASLRLAEKHLKNGLRLGLRGDAVSFLKGFGLLED